MPILTDIGFAFLAAIFLFLLLSRSFVHSEPVVVRQHALAGQAFLVEPIEEVLQCGCLAGLPARFKVSGGWGANGSLCVHCVRAEFARWVIHHVHAPKFDGAPGEIRAAAVAGNRE